MNWESKVDKIVTKAFARRLEQRAADEMIKSIIKLRWMGLEEEADRIQRQVSSLSFRAAGSVLAAPRETD
jgi:hypothetical protein